MRTRIATSCCVRTIVYSMTRRIHLGWRVYYLLSNVSSDRSQLWCVVCCAGRSVGSHRRQRVRLSDRGPVVSLLCAFAVGDWRSEAGMGCGRGREAAAAVARWRAALAPKPCAVDGKVGVFGFGAGHRVSERVYSFQDEDKKRRRCFPLPRPRTEPDTAHVSPDRHTGPRCRLRPQCTMLNGGRNAVTVYPDGHHCWRHCSTWD